MLALLITWPLDLPESTVPRWHLSQGLMGFVVLPCLGADPDGSGHPGMMGIPFPPPSLQSLAPEQDQARACLGKLDWQHSLSLERLLCHQGAVGPL